MALQSLVLSSSLDPWLGLWRLVADFRRRVPARPLPRLKLPGLGERLPLLDASMSSSLFDSSSSCVS